MDKMQKITTLDDAYTAIEKNWPFNKNSYPDYPEQPQKQTTHNIAHIQKHTAKTNGGIAALLEDADHGTGLTTENLKKLTNYGKQLVIQGIRLAQVTGTNAETMKKLLEAWVTEQNQKKI